jgi:hypothetical protein
MRQEELDQDLGREQMTREGFEKQELQHRIMMRNVGYVLAS